MLPRAGAHVASFASRATCIATQQRVRRRLAAAALAILVLDTVVLGAASAAGNQVSAPNASALADVPSVQYEQAMAHRFDPNTFTPGGRVSVGFTPRPSDHRAVGGEAPSSLPPGRASGAQMTGTLAGATSTAHPIDAPASTVGGVEAAAATATGYQLPAAPAAPAEAAPALTREVFGFLPYWELGASDLVLDYSKLSTIAYFAVNADQSGNLEKTDSTGKATTGWGGWTSSYMTNVINAAHANGVRVVLTVESFAWSTSQAATQVSLLSSDAYRLKLAQQTAAAVRDRGADGVNLDFEPIAQGQAANFVTFVRTLRAQLDAIHPGYQITIDTTGYPANYDLENLSAPGAADAFFIMGYDYRTASSPSAGSVSPLSGPVYDLTDTVRTYTSRVPASKIILGVPYYGRAWSTTSNALHATTQTGEKYGYSSVVYYSTGASFSQQYGRQYDAVEQAPWFAYQRQNCTSTYGCVTTWRQGYYDDPQSIAAKYEMVNEYGLRGSGIWALGYDGTSPDLYKVIAAKYGSTQPTNAPLPPATLAASSTVIPWGSTMTLKLSGQPDVDYDVLRSPDNASWSFFGTMAADAKGAASLSYRPATNTYWRVVPHGASMDPNAQVGGSPSVRVVVRQLAWLRPSNWGSTKTVSAGYSVNFYTVVRPIVAGQAVHVRFVVYRYTSGAWRLYSTKAAYTDSTGIARMTWRFATAGQWYVRSVADGTAVNTNSAWTNLERYNVR